MFLLLREKNFRKSRIPYKFPTLEIASSKSRHPPKKNAKPPSLSLSKMKNSNNPLAGKIDKKYGFNVSPLENVHVKMCNLHEKGTAKTLPSPLKIFFKFGKCPLRWIKMKIWYYLSLPKTSKSNSSTGFNFLGAFLEEQFHRFSISFQGGVFELFTFI